VNYSIIGTAALGTDYTLSDDMPASGQIVIPIGSDSAFILLTSIADHVPEKKETVMMTLSAGSNYKLTAKKKAKFKIIDSP
jgi:hypothetical protein